MRQKLKINRRLSMKKSICICTICIIILLTLSFLPNLLFKPILKAETTDLYIHVYIFSNSGTQVLYDSFYDSDTDFSKNNQLTATSDCYYRVEVTFSGFVGDEPKDSYCFVNPVYVSLP